MIFPYTEKQKKAFLTRFGQKVTINQTERLAIVETQILNENGQVSETLYITTDALWITQDDIVELFDNTYRVAYVVRDGSGLVDGYLSLTNDEGSKYV
ncbi:hypothetical protein LRM31_07315 [Enterobacter kobei]|uniref:hypothetical protein n=1 Tax=Enterobacter TaxID=547 RepID=UPI0005EDF7B9|nr:MULTISPECIES: hypothetical protein [Enterobacter]GHM25451.1 hypothetical protein EBZU44_39950 [Enterobacter cloacae]DAY67783.1 MAG TPA: ATP-binding sugar transporter [Caudoviricetes sp.]ELT0443079.1 hypothetical protein [Enterobacter hormaechei subsp. xiangfangensis]ELX8362376.1 hypothetical protein [Enterobacter hormaechei]KAA0856708.1 hypothetical protein EYC85_08250 [Enterobacter hormaechei]